MPALSHGLDRHNHQASPPWRKRLLAAALALAVGLIGALVPLAAPPAQAEASPATTWIRAQNTFYAYVGPGESLDVSFLQSSVLGFSASTVTVRAPGNAPVSCEITTTATPGTGCVWDDLTATEPGIWEISYGATNGTSTGRYVDWDITVQRGGVDIPGRVWSENYNMAQRGIEGTDLLAGADFTLYYQAVTGDQYRATYLGFNGIDSTFNANGIGLRVPPSCESYYESAQNGGPLSTGHRPAGPECGPVYKIFFEQPNEDLPQTATRLDGTSDWLLNPVVDPDLVNIAFAPTSGSTQAGTITFDIDNFFGNMSIQIDANGNGSYDDPEDRTIPYVSVGTTGSYAFDGIDGLGNPIPASQAINITAMIDRTGEIHFTNYDVELREGGIEVISTRGPDAGNYTLYWDDSTLNTQQDGRCSGPLDAVTALDGVSSEGGVHGWDYCGAATPSNPNDGVGGSYGDTRYIHEWTYRAVNVEDEVPVAPRAPQIVVSKTANPSSLTSVLPGQEVEYTVTFENTGDADGVVDYDDIIDGVLDDATVATQPAASDPALTVSAITDGRFAIDGTLSAGQEVTVTYSVTVKPNGERGDSVLGNFVVPGGELPPEECAEGSTLCTVHPVRHFSVTKTADVTTGVASGDVVTYTIRLTNDGGVDYTATDPAGFSDDLVDVVDDATYNQDATAVASDDSDVPAVSYDAPVLSWSGPLAAGEYVDFTYSVTVNNLGDADLINTAVPVCGPDEVCDPETPPVTILLPRITPDKDSDPATGSSVAVGEVINYSLIFTNSGQATGDVASTDDLSAVLDDAEMTALPTTDVSGVTATFDPATQSIRTVGPLAAGATVTVSYSVTVLADGERGDNVLTNVLTPDVPPYVCDDDDPECDPFTPPTTEHFIGELRDWKTVDPTSGSTVRAGQVVTYTLHFENIGQAPITVDREDDLTQVLDDAALTSNPVSDDDALRATDVIDGRFGVSGSLDPGQIVTVTYTVTVNADGARHDDRLANYLLDPGELVPDECIPEDDEFPDCTVTHVSNVVVTKSANPTSGTQVREGQQVTYTVTFRNVSTNVNAADADVDYTDHMAGVLDDATLMGGPQSSSGALAATMAGQTVRIVGAIPSGQTVTVSYSVMVKEWSAQGDHELANVVAVTGEPPVCAPGSELCTNHPLTQPDPLATTGGELAIGALAAGLLLTVAGGLLLHVRRRRQMMAD